MSRRIENHNIRKHRKATFSKKKSGLSKAFKTICIILLFVIAFGGFYTSAHGNRSEEPVNFKYYKSITVESGDSLWGLAEEYITDDYESIDEYIVVLKDINNLNSDNLKAGDKIIVAYNDTTYVE